MVGSIGSIPAPQHNSVELEPQPVMNKEPLAAKEEVKEKKDKPALVAVNADITGEAAAPADALALQEDSLAVLGSRV